MINNQKIAQAVGTPVRKHLVIGATSVAAAGALLGVGAAGASAATVQPTPAPTHSSSTTHSANQYSTNQYSANQYSAGRIVSLIQQLRADLFQGQISGSRAQALAGRITDNSAIFSMLPANLQNDVTTLKNAPVADAVADAQRLTSTALSGGYGTQIKDLATDLKASAAFPVSQSLVHEIRRDLATSTTLGETGTSIAKSVSEHPTLLASLPTNLKSDVAALKNAPSPESTLQTLGIEARAVAGGYGPQIQTLAQQLGSLTGNR
jgi:hypothetical protein